MKHNLFVLLPEILLIVGAFVLQMMAITRIKDNIPSRFGVLLLAGVMYMMVRTYMGSVFSAFSGSYIQDDYTLFSKIFIFGMSGIVIMNYLGYNSAIKKNVSTEYVVLILLSSVGAAISVSARDFLVLFVGLELQSICSYIMSAFNRDNKLSSEAGLKYFILGALSSCIMLFGISFIYGFTGSISYSVLKIISETQPLNTGLMAGIVFLLAGFMFKLSIVPFHMWTPDVYEGSPLMSVSFFSSVQKFSILSVVVLLFSLTLSSHAHMIKYVATIVSILSIIVGSIGAIKQKSLKRMMAYSTILNIGFAIVPFASATVPGMEVSLRYVLIYAMSNIALFSIVSSSIGANADYCQVNDLAGLSHTKKVAAVAITVVMFSMIGIPPFAGFWGKYYILYYALEHQQYLLTSFVLIGSIISAYYYLNIVRVMYFSEVPLSEAKIKLNPPLLISIVVSVGFVLFYSALPSLITHIIPVQ